MKVPQRYPSEHGNAFPEKKATDEVDTGHSFIVALVFALSGLLALVVHTTTV